MVKLYSNHTNMKTNHLIIGFLCIGILASCTGKESASTANDSATSEIDTSPPVLEYTAVGLTIDGPKTATAGWNTFRFINNSGMVHFALITKFPDSRDIDDHKAVSGVYQNFLDAAAGNELSEPEAGMEVPAWYGDSTEVFGGPGFVAPLGNTAVTLNLPAGYYVIECYVKTNGVFHSYNPDPAQYGMVTELTVTEGDNPGIAPKETATLTLSSTEGLQLNGSISAGENIVKVNFADQAVYEHTLGHDIHLAKLDGESQIEALNEWMNVMSPIGLESPAPVTFVGGTQDMLSGSTTYLHLDLAPGSYAWVSEVPDPRSKNLLQVFEVQ